jgi:DnaJ-class molecular chaperone
MVYKKNRCLNCLGSGFVKTTKQICENCNDGYCNLCDDNGFIKQQPFTECDKCDGLGEIEIKDEKQCVICKLF